MLKEIRVHWALGECDGVLQLLELYEDEDFTFLVLEYQSKGSLLKEVMNKKSLTEKHSKGIIMQLLLAIDFMHHRRIVHRDIKLDNILIN